MNGTASITEIGHLIQLAIAPVFLLTAVTTLINVLTGRLGRAIDRRRSLAVALLNLEGSLAEQGRLEFEFELRRGRLIYAAIVMSVTSALLVATLICVAFIEAFVTLGFARVIAVLFVLAMCSLMASLAIFLREIFLAVNSPRAPIL